MRRIAILGGSFNPPGLHHVALVEALAARFDEVRVIPCGPRPDKPGVELLPPVYRAAMADLAFGRIPKAVVDLFDLEQSRFTSHWQLAERFADLGELCLVVGADWVQGGGEGGSIIQRSWHEGERLWQEANFLVLTRPGHSLLKPDLPPHVEVLELQIEGSSTAIRQRLSCGAEIASMVPAPVAAYIERYGLYRAPLPGMRAHGSLSGLSFCLQGDFSREEVRQLSDQLAGNPVGAEEADFLTVLGGDGAMLRSIREHWRQRRPFFGINLGHLGFLMNAARPALAAGWPPPQVVLWQLPMLYIEAERADGQRVTAYGFNDAWLERSSSQSAWLEIKVNGLTRIAKLVGDGALVATAAGSTAYARSMGASPLLADTPSWLLVGSNVMEPVSWRSALLGMDSEVEMRVLCPEQRPVEAFVDGHSLGLVLGLKARISRSASVELAFCQGHDMAEKTGALQFPKAP